MSTSRRPTRPIVAAAAALVLFISIAAACSSSSTKSSGSVSQKGITVSNVWARESANAGGNGAAYFTIQNTSNLVDKLLSASVSRSVATSVSIHESMAMGSGSSDASTTTAMGSGSSETSTTMAGSQMMGMRPVASVQIPAGQSVTFEPGGYHVMLEGLVSPLKSGQKFDLTLGFMNAGSITVTAVVRTN